MNNVSLWLYLIDIIPSIAATVGGFSALFLIVSIFTFLIAAGHKSTVSEDHYNYDFYNYWVNFAKPNIAIFAILLFVCFLVPSKETLYLIAGSEIGETVVTSEYGQEMLDKISTAIDIQLEKLSQK